MQSTGTQAVMDHWTPEPPTLAVIGVGAAGSRAASVIASRSLRGVRVTCFDNDARMSQQFSTGRRVLVASGAAKPLSYGGDVQAVGEELQRYEARVRDSISGAALVIVIAGMAGRTGGRIGPEIARIARQAGATVVGAPLLPMDFEPISKHIAAFDAVTRFRAACNSILDTPDAANSRETRSLNSTLRSMRDYIADFAELLADVAGSPGGSQDGIADLLDRPGDVQFRSDTATGASALCEAAQNCFNGLDENTELERAQMAVKSGDDLRVADLLGVQKLAQSRSSADATLDLCIVKSKEIAPGEVSVSLLGTACQKTTGSASLTRPDTSAPLSASISRNDNTLIAS